jgi:hypothetical protein
MFLLVVAPTFVIIVRRLCRTPWLVDLLAKVLQVSFDVEADKK